MGHLKITPDMVSVTAVFVGAPDDSHAGFMKALCFDDFQDFVSNHADFSDVFNCDEDFENLLVRSFCENFGKKTGLVAFTSKPAVEVMRLFEFRTEYEFYTVSLLQLPQETSAVYLETYGVDDKLETTANPFYTDDLDTLELDITRYVVNNGAKAFEKTLYLHDGVLGDGVNTSRWEISDKPVSGNDFVVTLLADQWVEDMPNIYVPDGALTYHAISFWGVKGAELPPIDTWFEGTPLEKVIKMNEMLRNFISAFGLFGMVQMDFEDGRGEIGVCYKLV